MDQSAITSYKSQNYHKLMDDAFHTVDISELLKSLVSDPVHFRSNGLNSKEMCNSMQRFGTNNFTSKKKERFICKFIRLYVQPFNLLLLVASFLSFIVYFSIKETSSLFLGIGIISVSVMNTLIEFYQEYTTSAILEGFKSLVPCNSLVTREGMKTRILTNEILVGDLLHLKAGDKIPADIRVISATCLKVDNSSLTGESEPLTRRVENYEKMYINSENMLFAGNMVVSGEGTGVVVSVGDRTMLGKIAQLAVSRTHVESELVVEIAQYVKKLGLFALFISILFYAVAMYNGFSMTDNLSFCIGVFIAFVPQGLPATVTILLCIAAKRMAKRNVLVKDLRAVETLGSISLLATDKTGTITQGKMTCTVIWDGRAFIEDEKEWKKYSRIGEIGRVTSKVHFIDQSNTDLEKPYNQNDDVTQEVNSSQAGSYEQECEISQSNSTLQGNSKISVMSSVLTLNNTKHSGSDSRNVQFKDVKPNNRRILKERITGDPTELALYELCSRICDMKTDEKVLYEIPFDSERKYQLCIVDTKFGFKVYLKGAPEKILKYCSEWSSDSQLVSDDFLEKFKDTYYVLASQGHRVVAFAEKDLDSNTMAIITKSSQDPSKPGLSGEPENVLRMIGLRDFKFHCMIGIVDPPKNGVREAIMKLRLAGIRVVMITGDHPLTAEYIAKQTHILSQVPTNEASIISGDEISGFTDSDWEVVLNKRELVFARTTPGQKLLIVEKFQSFGHIVGVCGDGVNDSPALKRANLGISMNNTGSEASKEAASMILLDDDFTSIVDGVLEGRLVFVNLKKSIKYILSHITPQVIPFLLFVAIGVPSPMSALLLMFIDLFTEFFPAVLLAWEEPEGNLMIEAPRKKINPSISILPSIRSTVVGNPYTIKHDDNTLNEVSRSSIESTGESLCDFELLSWSYLEAGIITTLGALTTFFVVLYQEGIPFRYFTMSAQHFFKRTSIDMVLPDRTITGQQQVDILFKAQSAYFLAILIGQVFNLIACKRKYESLSPKTFHNLLPIFGSFFGFFFGLAITASPFLNRILQSRPVSLAHLLIASFICSFILVWDYLRKKMKRGMVFGKFRDTDALYRLKRTRLVSERC